MSATYSRNFREGGTQNCHISKRVFSGRIIWKHIENEKGSRGVRALLPQKIFENLHTVVAILALFEKFLGNIFLNFLPLNLSVSPNMIHFVRTFSIMQA